jgi:glycosyltransferase involved in cell wall biosynthesis
MAKSPLLSVVITSYTMERLDDIYQLLDGIASQSYQNTETIFVAERSRGLEAEIKAYRERKKMDNMCVLFNDGEPGASASRNLGIKAARGDIVAFIDDDAVPFPDWAEEMVKTYRDSSIAGVTGPAFPLWEDESLSWLPREFYWIISCTGWHNWAGITGVRNVWLENASFARGCFEAAGYLDTGLGPQDSQGGFKWREFAQGTVSEEVEFSLRVRTRLKKRLVYNPEVKVWHRVRKDRLKTGYIARWSFWMGLSKRKTRELYPHLGDDGDLMGQEHQLLERIMTGLFPGILRDFLTRPLIAWRKLSVTVTALFFVTLGYYSRLFPVR